MIKIFRMNFSEHLQDLWFDLFRQIMSSYHKSNTGNILNIQSNSLMSSSGKTKKLQQMMPDRRRKYEP